ncbi:hypothetical protein N9Y60_03135 [Crocinitomicaceae bacterium]|nr:hypothetical protein [Crocinitomicaceae bacterium]MDB3907216.1 hypothetical protein [Crocinitomicaceae bacterium]
MKLIAYLSAILITSSAFAQEEIIIIDRSKARIKTERDFKKNQNTQVVKYAPLSLFDGEILFGYERQLTAKGSFDVELGPTISKISFGVPGHVGNSFEPSVGETTGMGLVLGAAYRYYPLDETEALNRFYISPQFRYKIYTHSVQDYSEFVSGVQRGNETMANFFFNFGYQSWLSETFSLDFYFGIGIGNYSSRDYYAENFFNGTEWEYQWREETRSGARYVLNAGIKVGIGSK